MRNGTLVCLHEELMLQAVDCSHSSYLVLVQIPLRNPSILVEKLLKVLMLLLSGHSTPRISERRADSSSQLGGCMSGQQCSKHAANSVQTQDTDCLMPVAFACSTSCCCNSFCCLVSRCPRSCP